MKVLVAPDSFGGTLSAPQAARAIIEGWHRHAPDDLLTAAAMADGGPGFVDTVHAAVGGRLDVVDGTASRVIELTRQAGVAMTPAGAAFPYGDDPRDRNIRIAPSYPSPDELAVAIDVLATSVLIAAAEHALAE